MKKVKAFFIVAILAIAVFVVAVLGAARSFAAAMDEGMMMPASSGASRTLNGGQEGDPIPLVQVKEEDVVYTSFGRYYIGDQRTAVDVDYPMWISGGAGLRFWDDENWLISADVNVLRTFEGLYLVGGTTYNVDRTQADAEEFILLQLQNGLYMNAQNARFITKLDSYDIPANSLLMMGETALRWYSPDGTALSYGQAEEVFDAVLQIGDHEYDYAALLKALGLIGNAIDRLEKGEDPSEELNQAQELLSESSSSKDSGDSGNNNIDVSTETGPGAAEGEAQDGVYMFSPGHRQDGTEGSGADPVDTVVSVGSGTEDSSGSGSGQSAPGLPVTGEGTGEENGSGDGQGNGDTETPEEPGGSDDGGETGDNEDENGSGEGDSEDKPEQPGGGGAPEEGGTSDTEDGTSSGGGSGQPVPYQAPKVTLKNFNPWIYAVNMELEIYDPAGTITKGVSIAAYKSLDSDAQENGVTEDGYKIYTGGEGRSSILRKSYSSSQTVNLSPVSPNTTLYLQYSYTYIAEETMEDPQNPGNYIEVRVRRTYYSDFVEVRTPAIEPDKIPAVAADWEVLFAGHPDALQLDKFTLSNTTNYDPEDTSFENFKENMLPYANRIQLTLTPVDGGADAESKQVTISSTVLNRAQQEGGTSYTTGSPKLDSNQQYSVTGILLDRYGNELPLEINGTDGSEPFIAYTSKQLPSVEIIEKENITDKLTLTVKVSDPDGALALENEKALPLTLTALDPNGEAAVLTGTFEDGETFGEGSSKTLTLNEPEHEKAYTFTIDSLAFARTYQFRVAGAYAPQPDGVSKPSLSVQQNVVMGTARIYTASLSTGLINFSTGISNLLDTSVTFNASMSSKTTLDILPLVDEYRIVFTKDGEKDPVFTCALTMAELNHPVSEESGWKYDEERGGLVIQSGGENTPTITLVGNEDLFATYTPWDALSPKVKDPDATKVEYTTPAQIVVDLPSVLETSTKYNVQIQSVVIKGGEEYQIPTSITTSSFTTRKIQPKLQYSDLFAAGDVISLLNTRIFDPDGTIQENGLVYVYLYFNGTLLDMQEIYASTNENGPTQTLEFEGVTEGAEYELKFVAAAFNDSEGFANYQTNYLLWSYIVTGGSSLNGNIELESIEYASAGQAREPVLQMTGEEIRTAIANGDWQQDTARPYFYTTQEFAVPENITFLQITDFYLSPELESDYHTITPTFYNSQGQTIKHESWSQETYQGYGGQSIFLVPEGAVSYAFRLPVTEDGVLLWGLKVEGYSFPKTDLFQNLTFDSDKSINSSTGELTNSTGVKTSPFIPVTPGQVYTIVGNDIYNHGRYIGFYNSDGAFLGGQTSYRNKLITIPEEAAYIRLAIWGSWKYEFYQVSDVDRESGYEAAVTLEVNDNNGYLAVGLEPGQSPVATLEVYQSTTISSPQWELRESISLPLVQGEGNKYQLDPQVASQVLEGLPPNQSYRLELKAVYQDSPVVLDTAAFQTDGPYFVIRNQWDLRRVNLDPYANYLVVEDFTQDISGTNVSNLWGTIDFQGHVVTRGEGINDNLVNTIQSGGVVRNLVYDYPANAAVTAAAIGTNYGTLENIVVRTQGKVSVTSGNGPLILYQNASGAVLRNFILELGGDLDIYGSAALRSNSGLVENGYMYGKNGAGVFFLSTGWHGGLMYQNNSNGIVRNVFTLFDTWILESNAGALACYGGNDFSCAYHVGDFYQYTGDKNTALPQTYERIFASAGYTIDNHDVAYISLNTYRPTTTWVKGLQPAILMDQAWQDKMLGEAFDTDPIQVGFYPRLNLPAVMQKYQNYIPLPVLGDSAPQILSDEWASGAGASVEDTRGIVNFTLNNPRNATITGLKATGLKFGILDQKPLGEGLYQVTAQVEVDPENPQYLSTYTITQIQYTVGSSNITGDISYKTTGFEFWKTVSSAEDWADINDHMNWNYRITTDIDFQEALTAAAMVLNGSKTNIGNAAYFTGKLNGDGHTLYNITLKNTANPWLIYGMNAQTASITNLTIQDLTIQGNGTGTKSYGGLVGQINYGSLENVHLRDVSISAPGYVGGLAGYANNTSIRECSVAEAYIGDGTGNYPARVGGLVGYISNYGIDRCYTRNVEIEVTHSALVEGVGGLAGYNSYVPVTNSYAHGSIRVTGGYAGGINGIAYTESAFTKGVWADVDIVATGDQVGGFTGRSTARNLGGVVFGNIITEGTNVGRVAGVTTSDSYTGFQTRVYAYRGQTVNNLSAEDVSDARGLADGADLISRTFWVDTANMGDAFDYTQLTLDQPGMPLILREDGTLVEGQERIELPGQVEAPTLRITLAQHVAGSDYPFQLTGELQHPGHASADIIPLLQQENALSIDGIDISLENQKKEWVIVSFAETQDPETTNFTIFIREDSAQMDELFTKRLDVYTLTLNYQIDGHSWTLNGNLDFGYPLYWEVKNLTDWQNLMLNHAFTGENFLITGPVDFAGNSTNLMGQVGLRINRLEGRGDTAGFQGLRYTAGAEGTPWIESVYTNISGLTFQDFIVDFTGMTVPRGVSGVIMAAQTLSDCTFRKLEIAGGPNNNRIFGFFGQISGAIENLELEDIRLTVPSTASGGQYVGAFAGQIQSTFRNVEVNRITVEAPTADYVGGVFGVQLSVSGTISEASNAELKNISVNGGNQVGGLAYQLEALDGITLEDFKVEANANVGGLAYSSSGTNKINIRVKNGSVTENTTSLGAYLAGGVFGTMGVGYFTFGDVLVENVQVTGNNIVGGCIGSYHAPNPENIQVLNCVVTNPREVPASPPAQVQYLSVGGFAGVHPSIVRTVKNITIRDTVITGPYNAGGFVGANYGDNGGVATFQNIYVAEDVVVTSKGENAGGILGRGYLYNFTNVACGATVSAVGDAAGGIVGRMEKPNELVSYVSKMNNVYFSGQVDAGDYAGGIIGKVADAKYQLLPENYTGVIMTGSVRSGGEKASLWANTTASYGTAGDGTFVIWEQSTLNGQAAEDIQKGQQTTGAEAYLCPESGKLVSANVFNQKDFYTQLGFTETAWDLDALVEGNIYMPFLLDGSGSRLPNTDKYTYDQESGPVDVGILLPRAEEEPAQMVLYTTGVNTVTLDVTGFPKEGGSTASLMVRVGDGGNQEYTTDANGSISFSTDFQTPITVTLGGSSTTFDKDYMQSLRRNVMTWNGYWYYLDENQIVYGDEDEELESIQPIGEGETILHMWQGKVLCQERENYKVYSLEEDTLSQLEDPVSLNQKLENAVPLYTYDYVADNSSTPVKVFHQYSLFGNTNVDVRLFQLDGMPYVISPQQKVVPDGILLSVKPSITGDDTNYYALLQEDGILVDNRNNMKLENLPRDNIDQISNNLGYTGNVVVIQYRDGNVVVVDYATGELIKDTRPPVTAFLGYARAQVNGLMSFFGTNVSDSFLTSEATLGDGVGQVQSPEKLDGTGQGGDSQNYLEGDAVQGSGQANGTGGELDGSGNDLTAQGDVPDGMVPVTGEGQTTQGQGQYTYTPGEGLYLDGVPVEDESQYTYTPGEGLYQDGVLIYAQTGEPAQEGGTVSMAPAQNLVQGSVFADGQGAGTGNQPAQGTQGTQGIQALLAALGSQVVVYSEETGGYETVETAVLLGMKEETPAQEVSEQTQPEQSELSEQETAGNDFTVNDAAFGQKLTASERSGFVLLGAISVAALAALIILYFRYTGRKHKGS